VTISETRPDFHELVLTAVERDAADGLHLTFAVPKSLKSQFQFRAGQHITVRAQIAGREERRSYSICSGPGAPLTIAIKRVEGGVFSEWAHHNLEPGMRLDAMPPAGRFVLPIADGAARTYLAIAAGSGITPVLAMIRQTLVEEPAARFVLIYGNRTTGSILFRDAIDDLKDQAMGRLMIAHVLSRGDDADVPLLAGRIDAAKLEALVPKLVPVDQIAHAVLCGPDTLIKTAMKTLQELGVPREKIGFEFFIRGREARAERPAQAAPDVAAPTGPELLVVIDGARRAVPIEAGESILDAAIRAGINVPYSCKGGMCCTCRAKLVEGTAPMAQNFSLEAWEEEKGFILTCQARPTSPRVVVDYDQM
jgi:ring-1,2-phenylacetyl-CoA epoxidase subunit PaaE